MSPLVFPRATKKAGSPGKHVEERLRDGEAPKDGEVEPGDEQLRPQRAR